MNNNETPGRASSIDDELYLGRFISYCFKQHIGLCDFTQLGNIVSAEDLVRLRTEFVKNERER